MLNFAIKRKAKYLTQSSDGKKAFYIDVVNKTAIFNFLESDPARIKKFRYVLALLMEGKPPRDLYDRENIEKGCEHVTAIKLFKGGQNIRIYCQQFSDKGKDQFIIIASELLEKKKSQKNSKKELNIIRRVASYEYILEKDE